jgi:hypothetical protein
MADRVYLTIAEILAIHQLQIEEYGGVHGVRNQGLLESAGLRLSGLVVFFAARSPALNLLGAMRSSSSAV